MSRQDGEPFMLGEHDWVVFPLPGTDIDSLNRSYINEKFLGIPF